MVRVMGQRVNDNNHMVMLVGLEVRVMVRVMVRESTTITIWLC